MEFPNLTKARREFLEKATSSYVDQLAGTVAEEYLRSRGFTPMLIEDFRFGWVDEPVEGHKSYRGRISIPYITPAGVVGIRFRNLSGREPKYLNEEGSQSPIYNVRDFHRPEPYIAINEGEFDADVMSGLVGVPAVGIPGVDTWKANSNVWRRLFEDYERVFVCMDPDDPGQGAAKEIMHDLRDSALNILLPADVNETYLTFGPEFIRDLLGLE